MHHWEAWQGISTLSSRHSWCHCTHHNHHDSLEIYESLTLAQKVNRSLIRPTLISTTSWRCLEFVRSTRTAAIGVIWRSASIAKVVTVLTHISHWYLIIIACCSTSLVIFEIRYDWTRIAGVTVGGRAWARFTIIITRFAESWAELVVSVYAVGLASGSSNSIFNFFVGAKTSFAE